MKFELPSDDRNLSSPQHDALMIKLLSKDVWMALIREFKLVPDEAIEVGIASIKAEAPVIRRWGREENENRQIVGYVDIAVGIEYKMSEERYVGSWSNRKVEVGEYEKNKCLACEIKVTEPSFGSVLRQIQGYKQYYEADVWLVISPYEVWKEPLASQDILWIPASRVLEC